MYLNLRQAYQPNCLHMPSLKTEAYIHAAGNGYKNDYKGIKHA